MNNLTPSQPTETKGAGRGCLIGCLSILGLLGVIVLAMALVGGWWYKRNLDTSAFTPVQLDPTEAVQLEAKLQQVESPAPVEPPEPIGDEIPPYTETPESRVVSFTEKELNALLARQTELGSRAKLDLSDDLISLEMLVPLEEGFPLLGGKTVRLNAGLNVGYRDGKPYLAIRGISLGGVPLPSAWWGDIKNQDLVETFGRDGNFWDAFSRGVESLEVQDGRLDVTLKE
ncbi:MAG: arginine N-succinyltransferase [Kiritimatiellae bacterium]|nr:arginine N-succinyltransferase [Kiritimatiellia bacterium]